MTMSHPSQHRPLSSSSSGSVATTGVAILQAVAAYGMSYLFVSSGGG